MLYNGVMSGPILGGSEGWVRTAAGNARVETGGVLRLSVSRCAEGESARAQVEDEGLNRAGERGWWPPLLLQAASGVAMKALFGSVALPPEGEAEKIDVPL